MGFFLLASSVEVSCNVLKRFAGGSFAGSGGLFFGFSASLAAGVGPEFFHLKDFGRVIRGAGGRGFKGFFAGKLTSKSITAEEAGVSFNGLRGGSKIKDFGLYCSPVDKTIEGTPLDPVNLKRGPAWNLRCIRLQVPSSSICSNSLT